MKIHNKQARALLRKKDFTKEINFSKSLNPNRRKRGKGAQVEYVYTNNELEFILNKGLKDITSKDIMSDPFLFLMVTEVSLKEWIDLHKENRDIYIEEYGQVEVVMDIVSALDMYFDDDITISNDELKRYGKFSKIDKIIMDKLYMRSLFVENKQEKTFTIKAKSKLKRCTRVTIAKELYHLLCDDETKEEASKYIEEIKAFDVGGKVNIEHNIVAWLMNFVVGLWEQHDHSNCGDVLLGEALPF